MSSESYVVITGAAFGCGAEFAREFAERGYKLLLADIDHDGLDSIKKALEQKHRVTIETLTVDLTRLDDLVRLYRACEPKQVQFLINNAGIAHLTGWEEGDLENEMRMLDLNVRAVHWLTHKFASAMSQRGEGAILNMSSLAGLCPTPWMNAYSAGKAYVFSFSQALNYDLKTRGSRVRVAVATPGLLNTNIDRHLCLKLVDQHRSVPGTVAQIVAAFLTGKTHIITGRDHYANLVLALLPRRLSIALMNSFIPRMLVAQKHSECPAHFVTDDSVIAGKNSSHCTWRSKQT